MVFLFLFSIYFKKICIVFTSYRKQNCLLVGYAYLYLIMIPRRKRRYLLKKILIIILAFIVVGAGIYWYIATEKFSDTSKRRASYRVNAIEFIKEFQNNDNAANKKYTDKIIIVTGIVSEIEMADTTINIKFIDTASNSYAIFAFQEQHLEDAKTIKRGDTVSIKGSCSGGIYSEILGTEAITFKRCALNKKNRILKN